VCYDERGYQYKVPQYCYTNPVELTFEPTPISSAVETLSTESVRNNNTNSAGNSNKNEAIMPNTGPQIKLKIRVNPGKSFFLLCLFVSFSDVFILATHSMLTLFNCFSVFPSSHLNGLR
jgi:hypothetical protein